MNKRIKKKYKKRMCYEAMALHIVYQCAMNITKTSPTSRVSHIGVSRIYHASISIIKTMKSNKLKKFIKHNMYLIPEYTLVHFRTNPYTSSLFHHHNNKNILTRIMVHDFNKVHDNRTYTLDHISLINNKKIYIKTLSPIEEELTKHGITISNR